MKLFELFATLGLDASRFDAGVNNAQKTISKAKTAITKAGKAISAVGKTTYKVSASIIEQTQKSLKSVVKSATASTAAVGAAAVAIGKKMLDARSSVEQGITDACTGHITQIEIGDSKRRINASVFADVAGTWQKTTESR